MARKKKVFSRVCPYCQSRFKTTNKQQVYCNFTCKNNANLYIRPLYTCSNCGHKEYRKKPS